MKRQFFLKVYEVVKKIPVGKVLTYQQVAKLAGLPAAVTARAAEVLELLEKSDQSAARLSLADDLPLFSAARPQAARPRGPSEIETMLAAMAPDELSPREALALLYELRAALPKTP